MNPNPLIIGGKNKMETKQMAGFIGSRCEGESMEEHIAREAQWMVDHSCHLCGCFDCDGHCEDGGY